MRLTALGVIVIGGVAGRVFVGAISALLALHQRPTGGNGADKQADNGKFLHQGASSAQFAHILLHLRPRNKVESANIMPWRRPPLRAAGDASLHLLTVQGRNGGSWR